MIEILRKYESDGLLRSQVHNDLPLSIWNYTPKTAYEQLWDEITLQCRGLVTDDKGNIIARPFKKFFNIEENRHIPTSKFEVYEKMDGSLGIVFFYNDEWHLCTRGSFHSDQSIKGRELLSQYDLNSLSPGYTYLFEIIYKDNRIVCKYDYEDVVLLGGFEVTDGNEIDIHDDYYTTRFNVVKRYDGISDYTTLKDMVRDNREGFVVKFSNGERCKIKGEEYIRLHKIMTNISTVSIWEAMSKGISLSSILEDIPDEMYDSIRYWEERHQNRYDYIHELYLKLYNNILTEGFENRAEFASHACKLQGSAIMFRMYDGKRYDDLIWKLCKPIYAKL